MLYNTYMLYVTRGEETMQTVFTSSSSAYRLAYETIRTQILGGELDGGTKLVEERLAEDIGVSRTPIREAIRHLEQEGLIRNKRVYNPTKEDLIHAFEFRSLIECYAIQQAAKNMSVETLNELKLALEDSQKGETAHIVAANKRFHNIILTECNNPVLIRTSEQMDSTIHIASQKLVQNKRPLLYEEHRQLYHAIKDRDESLAAELMKKHLNNDLSFMLQLIE